jgi:DNA repair protein RecO (recombination protein O)
MLSSFKGLVLSELPWGENDKILSVLTAEYGKISVLLKGGSSLKNKLVGASMPLCYSEFITADRGGRAWIREAHEIEGFMGIRSELELTATALYICEVANEVCVENGDETEMLQLVLNTLYALDRKLKPREIIKAAFELRAAVVCGFTPDLVNCSECGRETSEIMYLDVMDGVMHCLECHKKRNLSVAREGHTFLLMPLDRAVLDAMRYVSYSPAKKYLSFELPKERHATFSEYCEKYLINHIDKSFKTLDFLKSISFLPKT